LWMDREWILMENLSVVNQLSGPLLGSTAWPPDPPIMIHGIVSNWDLWMMGIRFLLEIIIVINNMWHFNKSASQNPCC
jgi:hypothetical protein